MPRVSRGGASKAPGLPEQTFVLDNGAYTIKAGFAPREAAPDTETLVNCQTIPNCLVRTRDRKVYVSAQAEEVTQWSEAIFRRPLEHGQLVNWEAQKEIWERSFFDDATAHPKVHIQHASDTTLILTETPNTMPALQKNADEIIMEEWGFGGYMRVLGPSLNAYNDLHPTFEDPRALKAHPSPDNTPMECLLVIDSGYSHTTVTPVFQGQPLQRAVRRLEFGGKQLTNLLKEIVSIRHYDLSQDLKIVNDIKEDVCFVSVDFKGDMEKTWKGNKHKIKNGDLAHPAGQEVVHEKDADIRRDYVLPDGVRVLRGYARNYNTDLTEVARRKAMNADGEIVMPLGNERFTIPEIVFNPSDIGSKQPGLADCVIQSLAVLPPLVQAAMLANTLVVGGNAKLSGFVQRLQDELRSRVKTEWMVRVKALVDPITTTWLGGARMASRHRDIVNEYAVTKEEYDEHGSAWVARRFVLGKTKHES